MTSTQVVQKQLRDEHFSLRRKFEACSPIVTIQKNLRMLIQKRLFQRKRVHTRILYWALRRYYKRLNLLELMRRLKLTKENLKLLGKIRLIQKHYKAYLRRKFLYKKYTLRLQSLYRMRKSQN